MDLRIAIVVGIATHCSTFVPSDLPDESESVSTVYLGPWQVSEGESRLTRLEDKILAEGDVRTGLIHDAVESALRLESSVIKAELILALAYHESRLELDVVTGRVCGPMQVAPMHIDLPWTACEVWARDPYVGYSAGVLELRMLLADPRVNGDMDRALRYRACGNTYFAGTCNPNQWIREIRLLESRLLM